MKPPVLYPIRQKTPPSLLFAVDIVPPTDRQIGRGKEKRRRERSFVSSLFPDGWSRAVCGSVG